MYQPDCIIPLRPFVPSDGPALCARLSPPDREELHASHPHQKIPLLLLQFAQQSAESFTFVYRGAVVSVGGVTAQGLVWLLTSRDVHRCPKTFVATARNFLQQQLRSHPFLCNWVDENHHTARRFITHLGGVFTGEYQILSGRKFLFFIFRRHSMGGIIQSGRSYTSTAARALKAYKKNNAYFTQQADQLHAAGLQTQLNNQLQTDYIFRSAAEKNRLLQDAARAQQSTLQNTLAQHGLDGSSATVQLLLEKNRLAAAQEQAKIAQNVAAQINAADEETAAKIAALREQEATARKKANQKSTLWKMTKQLFSWFK